MIEQMITNLEQAGVFAYLLPWLLTLAVVFGLLEHYEIPKSVSARGVISIVIAFLVLPAGNAVAPFLEGLVKGFIVIASGILVTIIFVEMLGFKAGDVENIFEKHPRSFGGIMIILAILVFIGAGGLEILDVSFEVSQELITLLFFLAVISIGGWFMISEE
ncbi:MAG: hypothetical protein ACLFTQ_00710 [Candidatus Aenigmatarchaeota archaeon]